MAWGTRAAAAAVVLCCAAPASAHARAVPVVRAGAVPSTLAATPLGAVAPSAPMEIGIVLAHPHPAAEDALLAAQADRSSPQYHRFLTPAQYAQRFGVARATRQRATRWLTGGGLRVVSTTRTGDYVVAKGTAGEVAKLLSVTLKRFDGFTANTTVPRVPSSVPVLDVVGLDSRDRHHTLQTPDTGNRTAAELRDIYQHPAAGTDDGKGVSVAILGAGSTDKVVTDLAAFDDQNGLARVPTAVKRTPASGDYSDEAGLVEWNIDSQAVHGMAPGLDKEVFYFSPTLADTQLTASLGTWVNDPDGPPIMNASLGECEELPVVNPILNNEALAPINGNGNPDALPVSQAISQASEPATTQLLQQAVMEGRNFFAASGDNGSSCTLVYPGTNGIGNYGVPLTSDPASVPFATAVGGTVLYSDGRQPAGRALEYAWTASGGNSSPFIPAGKYQQGIQNLNRPCVVDGNAMPTNTGQLCRAVPDVSALSGDVVSNGYAIVSDGQPASGGGTSLSSPLWAGMWARVVSSAPAGTSGYGFANQALYDIGRDASRYAASFFDVTTGTNGLNPALPGYDYVTGLGVPKLRDLIANVKAVAPAVPVGQAVPTAGQAPAIPGCTDRTRPTARIRTVKRASHRRLRLRGTAADAGCGEGGAGKVTRVAVAVARVQQVGARKTHRCRFVTARGRLTKVGRCRRRTYLTTKGTTSWSLTTPRLRRGFYVVTARAVDAARNTTGTRAAGVNVRRLRVR